MTPDELEHLVLSGNARALVERLAPLTEPQRQKLSKSAAALYRAIEDYQWKITDKSRKLPPIYSRIKQFLAGQPNRNNSIDGGQFAAALAVLGVCPLSSWKKLDPFSRTELNGLAKQVLSDRRPEFLDEYVESQLAKDWSSLEWDRLRALIATGLCKKPSSEGYYRLLGRSAYEITDGGRRGDATLADRVAVQPDLLDDLWKLLEIETDAFSTDFSWDKESAPWRNWSTAMIGLSARGLMDRGRLLRASVEALLNPWKINALSSLARLHESLEPTEDELADLQPVYVDLLSSPQSQVASFGVKMLKAVDAAGRLDAERLTAAAGVFSLRTKGPAKGVITMLKRLAKGKPPQREAAGNLLAEALIHEAADVQSAALKALMPLAKAAAKKKGAPPPWVASVRDRLPDLAAVARPTADELLALFGVEPPEPDAKPMEAPPSADLKAILAEAADLPEKWRHLAGLEPGLLEAGTQYPQPMPFRIDQVPVLTGVEPITPIATVDELIDAVAHAVEQVDGPDELERILDGISRLCDQRPEDFERRTEAIQARAVRPGSSGTPRGITEPYIGSAGLRRVVLQWFAGKGKLVSRQGVEVPGRDDSIFDFLDLRLLELWRRVEKGVAAPLLAAPTHQRGWIDPRVLVERWLAMEARELPIGEADCIAALLRLAPDGRAEALQKAKEAKAPEAAVLRYALGSDDPTDRPAVKRDSRGFLRRVFAPAAKDDDVASLWLAAGRCRSPFDRLHHLAEAAVDAPGPDGIEPAVYSTRPARKGHDFGVGRYSYDRPTLRVGLSRGEDEAKGLDPTRPTRLLHAGSRGWHPGGSTVAWARRWSSMTWPMNADPGLATAATSTVRRIDEASSAWEPNHAFLDPLFDVDRPWSEITCFAVATGLAGRDQDARGVCLDATIEAIEDGRFRPELVAPWVIGLSKEGLLKLNRVTDAGTEIARVSDLHTWTMAELSAAVVAGLDPLPRDIHHLLALLLELLKRLDLPLPPAARPVLEGVSGSSKTAKLPKLLLVHEGNPASPAIQQARAAAATARLGRAQRWADGAAVA